MKRIFVINCIAVAVSLSCMSCDKLRDDTFPEDELTERVDFVLTRSEQEFVTANNGFAFDLFRNVTKNADGKSLLISPLSVTIDLGMVCNGAVGTTRQEIYETLGYKESAVDGLNAFCMTMMEQSVAVDRSTTLEYANAVIANNMFPGLKDSFIQTVQSVYDAEVVYKDFSKDDIQKLVNDWCNDKTHGMIPELLKDRVKPEEYAHVLNAVYFKGIWSHKFKKSDTHKEDFTRKDGSTITVNMMHQKDKFNFGVIRGLCYAVTLPYGNQAFRMTLLLPEKGKTFDELSEALDAESWDKLEMLPREVDVKIPSFETEYYTSMSSILKEMGIQQAFGGVGCNFSDMFLIPSLHISDVVHKSKIKVNEEGAEAAAVTDTYFASSSISSDPSTPPTFEFHADRPFLYVITEVSSGAVFFIGQYTGK